MADLIREAASDMLGNEQVDEIHRPSMGSEDFAVYLKHVPGAMFRVGSAGGESSGFDLHTPTFDVDESALKIGAKILARTAMMWSEPGSG